MMSEKGIEFSMVVVLAIAVGVLLLVGAFYTGAFKSLTGKTTSFAANSLANSSESGQIAKCNMLCTAIVGCTQAEEIIRYQTSGCNEFPCDKVGECVACTATGVPAELCT